jgi:hypothetical protein
MNFIKQHHRVIGTLAIALLTMGFFIGMKGREAPAEEQQQSTAPESSAWQSKASTTAESLIEPSVEFPHQQTALRRAQPGPFKLRRFTIDDVEITMYAANQSNPTDSLDWYYAVAPRIRNAEYVSGDLSFVLQ